MSDICQEWAAKFSNQDSPVRVHLIGVAGSGMSGLASLLIGLGHKVSGSDRVTSGETERLEKSGLIFSSPHSAEAVEGVDVVIYSSAIKEGNAAFDATLAAGIPKLRRAEALSAIMLGKKGVVVAGTHGKTTTSALAAHVLKVGAKNPSHYVGAEIPILGRNANWDEKGDYFVAEGDESDGTLVNFHPEHAILLNVEAEHLDFYDGLDAICDVFGTFCDQTNGKIFYCGDDPNAERVCGARENSVSYGWAEGLNFTASNLSPKGAGTEFTVKRDGEELGRVRLGIPGRHNVLNALAVIALCTELEVSFDRIDEALASFRGAKRRFELKRNSDRITIVDDYGHHPTEIAATIQTARSQHAGRLICLFQPHRFTRTQLLRDEFGACFTGVDELWVTDIYPASEKPIPGITGDTIVEAVKEFGEVESVHSHPDLTSLHLAAGHKLKAGDWVMTLGAGNIHEVGNRLAKDLATVDLLTDILDEAEGSVRLYEPMRRHTTMKVGGPAQFWIEPTTEAGLARIVKHCADSGLPLRVVGRGSNLLVRDGGIPGVVVNPVKGAFSAVHAEGNTITAGAGVKFKALAAAAQSAGLGDFEWMEGIPGNVGGSLRMNAGAMGTETFDQVVSVRMIDAEGVIFEKPLEEIRHHYRNVPELAHNVAVSAVFKGTPKPDREIADAMTASKEKRRSSQPVAASAGCIFKNPEAIGAGQLVDELGLKNTGVGNAEVSEVHGNFIVNQGKATAKDVLDLIAQIKAVAKKERGIDLETEVQIIGQDDPI
ncbi:UDP-N-acetylmuramate--L-alanine ligase [Verrucomicrobiales bacterium BCK34]|nr:UDP-N-acetylmuramate--L-alanine ligase [Verrucomicrobiales bacterium BCK34]